MRPIRAILCTHIVYHLVLCHKYCANCRQRSEINTSADGPARDSAQPIEALLVAGAMQSENGSTGEFAADGGRVTIA